MTPFFLRPMSGDAHAGTRGLVLQPPDKCLSGVRRIGAAWRQDSYSGEICTTWSRHWPTFCNQTERCIHRLCELQLLAPDFVGAHAKRRGILKQRIDDPIHFASLTEHSELRGWRFFFIKIGV